MTKVMITGASGMIGSNVLEYLLKHTDWEFVCICSWRHKGNPLRIKPNQRVTVITHDLVGVIPDLGRFDYILNLASESHVDRSIADPVNFIENNISSTLQVLEYARRYMPDMFIQFSTDEVFGTSRVIGKIVPSNPYSASKASQEMICMSYARTYGIPIVITNCNNVIGKYQDREKFIPKVIDLIRKDLTVKIHTKNGKIGKRYYNDVRNVASALLFIIQNKSKVWFESGFVRFGLPGGEQFNNKEIADMIQKLLKKETYHCIYIDVEKIRPGYDEYYPITETTLEDMGFTPEYTVIQALREVIKYA